jgi:F-type H+-transporting ATPase subunit a
MALVQYYGFKYLGAGYLKKFFPTHSGASAIAKNPIKAIDWAVGILELVGEISRIISFSFRLLGNIFAGQILLFVIAFLVPAISVVFFGLEFFVGLIQAVVFGLLALMFMSGASEHHGDGDHHD